jgi:hypothetical protein
MIFIENDEYIKGYIPTNYYATFFFCKEEKKISIDKNYIFIIDNIKIRWDINLKFNILNPYNIYWYFKIKSFIKKQKTYKYLEFCENRKTLFKNLKREKKLNKILNS